MTLNWHWLLAAMVAPARAMPVGAVVVSVPPQTVADALATVKPVGRVSVNATPACASTFAAGFVIVNVSDVVACSAIDVGLNALLIEGGASTLTEAVALVPVPPSVDVTFPVVLFSSPAPIPVTFTAKVQELLAAIVPLLRLITFVPGVAVIVPLPQEPVRPFGLAMTRPAGIVSVKATPVIEVPLLAFWRVKVRLVEPFSGILAAPNVFAIRGGPTTVIEALEVLPVPPSVDVTVTLLFLTPTVEPWISTERAQEAEPASVPPDIVTEEDPAIAVTVPPHVFVKFGVELTTIPAGKESVNAIPSRETLVFGF